MRILLVGLGYRGYTPLYSRALEKLGHEVHTYVGLRQWHWPTRIRRLAFVRIPAAFGYDRDYLWSEQMKFRAFFRRSRALYDLVLFANADRLANDETLAEIRERRAASALWLLDDVGTIPTSGLDFRSFDYLASFNAHQARDLGRSIRRHVHYVPQGFAPIEYTPSAAISQRSLVLGAAYPSRRDAVKAMLAVGLDVDVVGRTWSTHERNTRHLRLLGDVSLSQSLSLSSSGRVCVNGHRSASTGVSPRVFEIGGAGGVIISDNVSIPEFFEPGAEMLWWSTPEEAADHALRAHRDSQWAARIAAMGQRRTEADHTIERRFTSLLSGWGFA